MSSTVLVLNRGYQPVGVCGVQRAFGLLYAGIADALDSDFRVLDYREWSDLTPSDGYSVIRTVDNVLMIPKVMVLRAFSRVPRTKVKFSRRNVYLRDDMTCQYCRRKLPRSKLNLDHVIPRSQGGKTRWDNIVCSCLPCNMKKGARTPEQAGMSLMRPPKGPSWGCLTIGGKVPHKEWLPFLDRASLSYWNLELDSD